MVFFFNPKSNLGICPFARILYTSQFFPNEKCGCKLDHRKVQMYLIKSYGKMQGITIMYLHKTEQNWPIC